MKKRLIGLALALVCLCTLAAPAFAASNFQEYLAETGRMKYVNYDRIRQHTIQRIPVTLELGSQTFRGMLRKGYTLDNETTDKIIRAAMLETQMNEKSLVACETAIHIASKLDGNFKVGFWIEMIGQFLGGGTVIDILKFDKENESGTQFLLDHARDQLFSDMAGAAIGALAPGAISAFVLNGLANCSKSLAEEAMQKLIDDQKKQEAIEAAIKLDMFYARCNELIQREAEKKDTTNWRLKINQTVKVFPELFGAPLVQSWTLRCDLKKKEATEGFAGDYEGLVQLDIDHDMTKFDGKFLKLVVSGLPVFDEIIVSYPFMSLYDCWQHSSILEKEFRGNNVRITIPADAADGAEAAAIPLSSLKTRDEFWMMHPIWIVPDGILPYVDKNGRYSFSGMSVSIEGQVATTVYLAGEMWDGLSPQIYALSSNAELWRNVTVGQQQMSWDQSDEGGGAVLVVNHDLFKDLASGKISLKFGWEEDA